jgi:ketosteroid isomerase-like protein
MSEENVEVVRAGLDAYARGDWDIALKDAAPDFEFDMSRAIGPQRGVYGHEQMQEVFSYIGEGFDPFRIEPHEFIEVGEHVVVPLTAHGVGRDGIEVEARSTLTWTIQDGAVARICLYQEREEALEAVGLSE